MSALCVKKLKNCHFLGALEPKKARILRVLRIKSTWKDFTPPPKNPHFLDLENLWSPTSVTAWGPVCYHCTPRQNENKNKNGLNLKEVLYCVDIRLLFKFHKKNDYSLELFTSQDAGGVVDKNRIRIIITHDLSLPWVPYTCMPSHVRLQKFTAWYTGVVLNQ